MAVDAGRGGVPVLRSSPLMADAQPGSHACWNATAFRSGFSSPARMIIPCLVKSDVLHVSFPGHVASGSFVGPPADVFPLGNALSFSAMDNHDYV